MSETESSYTSTSVDSDIETDTETIIDGGPGTYPDADGNFKKVRFNIPESEEESEGEEGEGEESEGEESEGELEIVEELKLPKEKKKIKLQRESGEEDDVVFYLEEEIDEMGAQMEILQKENPVLYQKFTEVKDYLTTEIPKINVVLETPMHLQDRARIIELFEMFYVVDPLTYEWLELKEEIKILFQRAVAKYGRDKNISDELRKKVADELEELRQMNKESTEYQIAMLNIPVKYKGTLYTRYKVLEKMDPSNDEYGKLSDWVTTVLKVPFGIQHSFPTTSSIDKIILDLQQCLNDEFYGLEQVKEQILIYVSNKLYYPSADHYPLGLIGPPGTGKTNLALAVSKALTTPFQQLSGGSLAHNDGIHGHSYTYVGSQPGHIVNALVQMECMNGILFIDEFDKISLEKSLNSILQLIDPVQNHNFKDNYIGGDIPVDLSKIWYILSMNEMPQNQALRDRIFPIYIAPYTSTQKFNILKNHTMKKLLSSPNLNFTLRDDILRYIVQIQSDESSGMRQCIHMLKDLISKIVFVRNNPSIQVTFKIAEPSGGEYTLDMVRHIITSHSASNTYSSSMYI